MSARLEDGFATLEEAADTIAAYVPHRERPKNLDGLAKNLRRHADGRYRWHWDPQFMAGKRRRTCTRSTTACSRRRAPCASRPCWCAAA